LSESLFFRTNILSRYCFETFFGVKIKHNYVSVVYKFFLQLNFKSFFEVEQKMRFSNKSANLAKNENAYRQIAEKIFYESLSSEKKENLKVKRNKTYIQSYLAFLGA